MDETAFQTLKTTAFVLSFAAVYALQVAAPHQRRQRYLPRNWRINLPLAAIDIVVLSVICGACVCTVARLAAHHRLGLLHRLAVPAWVQIAMTVAALDAVSYAWHRANHRVRLLWRFHAVHHADRELDLSSGVRFHPGELLLSLPVRMSAVTLLGARVEGLLVFEIIFGFANLLEHGNIRLSATVERVAAASLVTPALHRLHHSARAADLNSNYGTILSTWDRLFGTFRYSGSDATPATGLPGRADEPAPNLWASLRMPIEGVPGPGRASG